MKVAPKKVKPDQAKVAHPPLARAVFPPERWSWTWGSIIILVLTLVTVFYQEDGLRLQFMLDVQLPRHYQVLNHTAANPWCYRILSEYISSAFLYTAEALRLPTPVLTGFVAFRLLQNVLIFALAVVFYQRLGLTAREAVVGIALLAFSITYARYGSDLSFNTYTDVLFYLLAACLVFSGSSLWWLLPLTILAALNRETSMFIPFMPLATLVAEKGRGWRDWMPTIRIAGICLLVHVAITIALRLLISTPIPQYNNMYGFSVGWGGIKMNLGEKISLLQLGLTLSILPLGALWNFRRLPAWLQGMFWIMIPIWFLVHILATIARESRLFLVPIAIVFIPATLWPRDRVREEIFVAKGV